MPSSRSPSARLWTWKRQGAHEGRVGFCTCPCVSVDKKGSTWETYEYYCVHILLLRPPPKTPSWVPHILPLLICRHHHHAPAYTTESGTNNSQITTLVLLGPLQTSTINQMANGQKEYAQERDGNIGWHMEGLS